MFHLAWKMVASLINLLPRLHFTTTTVHQEMPDCIKDGWVGSEEHGVPDEVTKINGFSLILEDVLVSPAFPHRVVRILISGSQVIMWHTVEVVSISHHIEKDVVQR